MSAEPSSFCFVCTDGCYDELVGMLLSLSMHHPGAAVFGLVDSFVRDELQDERRLCRIPLRLRLRVSLDAYTGKNRSQMVSEGLFGDFLSHKSNALRFALTHASDTLLIDTDVLFLRPLRCVDKTKDLGVSPHYIPKSHCDRVGKYNAGCLWVREKTIPDEWDRHTTNSRYYEQASIEDLARSFSHFEFGAGVNVMPWRVLLADKPDRELRRLCVRDGGVCYGSEAVVFAHTHFYDERFRAFNGALSSCLRRCRNYRELLIIQRVLRGGWVVDVPAQPQSSLWRHKNDSFRELVPMMCGVHKRLKMCQTSGCHCVLNGAVVLYDRDGAECAKELPASAPCVLLGNGDAEGYEGDTFRRMGRTVSPWSFWARHPAVLERYTREHARLLYNDRPTGSIFIGNIENGVQMKHRGDQKWAEEVDVYHCTVGRTHMFSQEDYLTRMAGARYGLALRGYGSKCNREIEMLALGTVPLVTEGVCVTSFINPLVEGVHYLRVRNAGDLRRTVRTTPARKWDELSRNGVAWYARNCRAESFMPLTLNHLLHGGRAARRVAVLVPSTSRKRSWASPAESYLSKFTIPTATATVGYGDCVFYVGVDPGDRIYDNGDMQLQLRSAHPDAEIVFVRMDGIKGGHLSKMWNRLFSRAYGDGCDYFVVSGDDVEYQTAGWLDECVRLLRLTGGIGVAGPVDTGNKRILTNGMCVTRDHMRLFGWLFPEELLNWCTDDWLNDVYRPNYHHTAVGSTCRNRGGAPRYDVNNDPSFDEQKLSELRRTCSALVSRHKRAVVPSAEAPLPPRLAEAGRNKKTTAVRKPIARRASREPLWV